MPELFWKKNCLAMEQNSGTPTQRVAEAIWEVHFADQGGSWPDASDDQKANYLRMAQAAIDALGDRWGEGYRAGVIEGVCRAESHLSDLRRSVQMGIPFERGLPDVEGER